MTREFPIRMLAAQVLLCAATMGSAFAQAPTASPQGASLPAPHWILVTEVSVKPEMMGQFQGFMKETMDAMRKGGATNVDVWQPTAAAGSPFDYIVAVHMDNLADLDNPGYLEKGLGAAGMATWQAKAGQHVSAVNRYVLRTRPDLSHAPTMSSPPKLAVVTSSAVVPGHGEAYEQWIKNEYLPVAKKGSGAYWVSQTIFGGEANEYVSLTTRESFADLAKGPTAVQVLGEEGNRALMRKIPGDAVARVERTLVRYVPELSITPAAQK